jgi:hypothetical protein
MKKRCLGLLSALVVLACAGSDVPVEHLETVITSPADIDALTALGLPETYVQSRARDLAVERDLRSESVATEQRSPTPVSDHPTASLDLEFSENGRRIIVWLSGVDVAKAVQFGLECSENITLTGWAAVSGYLEITAPGFPKSGEGVALSFSPEEVGPEGRLRIGSVVWERAPGAPADPVYVRIVGVWRDFDRAMVVDGQSKSTRITRLGGLTF